MYISDSYKWKIQPLLLNNLSAISDIRSASANVKSPNYIRVAVINVLWRKKAKWPQFEIVHKCLKLFSVFSVKIKFLLRYIISLKTIRD